MTTTKPTTDEIRKLAQDALALAEKATPGPWFGVTNLEVQTKDVALAVLFDDGFDYDQALANAEYMGKARQLVPDLATALLAVLDRADALEAKYESGNKLVLNLDKSYVVKFPHTNEAVGVTVFGNQVKEYGFIGGSDCPFCHHKGHADKGCGQCSCKTGVIKDAD